MSMQFGYVSPEQIMKDRADYARKGIARAGSVVVLQYEGGIVFVAENPSPSLHKISEIYDRIAFAAVGKYNEFEVLRQAGVRMADLRGYSFDRVDVSGRALANVYAQTLGTIFTQDPKAYEVEIVVAEIGDDESSDVIYRIVFDGSVFSEDGFAVMGGPADQVAAHVRQGFQQSASLEDSVLLAAHALRRDNGGEPRQLASSQLEVAVLERSRPRRTFRRIRGAPLEALLAEQNRDATETASDESGD